MGGRPKYNLEGQQFGSWSVLKEAPRKSSYAGVFWLCKCSCGNELEIIGNRLVTGKTKQCKTCAFKYNKNATTHGKCYTPEYRARASMINRCYLPSVDMYPNYGGRGIQVCQEWLDKKTGLQAFLNDMGCRPSSNHSLDRINPNGNYEPSNCRWATRSEQSVNRRTFVAINNHDTKDLIEELSRRGYTVIRKVDNG